MNLFYNLGIKKTFKMNIADKRKANLGFTASFKKQKLEGHHQSSFEEDLALYDAIEKESKNTESQDSQNKSGPPPRRAAGNNSNQWMRPDVPNINPDTDHLIFQQMEVDHYVGK